ncbi:hypothetical protein HPB48_008995 [Haemaphysalis longicornis]|uniref:Calcium-activated chloride channel N-terminal domain-containing protein n=1 Tax=Haemaphysalis longicornis TaxID=44386 RepID=A0A9J6H345_HAELO|nr:hypothetical protein HPB48_008995 [Haemaphysalis longicornis]
MIKKRALLRNASISLFQSTRSRAFLEEVIVLVPKSWGPKETCTGTPDLKLEPQGGPFGDNPFTVQHAGCGMAGKRLALSAGFLTLLEEGGTAASKYGPPDRVFVREWGHYRYGVFSETGYTGDMLYPAYRARPGGTDAADVTLTTCTNQPLELDWRTTSGQTCVPRVDPLTGRPREDDCHALPNRTQENVFSSIMALQTLPNVNQFCDEDEHLHDDRAPTKQNALCDYRSTWDVIANHPDFYRRNQAGERLLGRTRFHYVQEAPLRIVMVVQVTAASAIRDRRAFVSRALDKFARVDAPDDSRLGLVPIGQVEASTGFPLSPMNRSHTREQLALRLPWPGSKFNLSIEDGLSRALQPLEASSFSSATETWSTHEVAERPPGVAEIVPVFFASGFVHAELVGVCIIDLSCYIIPAQHRSACRAGVPEFCALSAHLDALVEATGGRTWHVHEASVGDEQRGSVATQAELYEALYSLLLRGYSWDETDNYVMMLSEDRDLPYPSSNGSAAAGGVILLISNGDLEHDVAERLQESLRSSQVRLQSVVYPSSAHSSAHLDALVEATGGRTWHVHEASVGDEQRGSVATQAELYEALYSLLLRGYSWDETDNYVMVDKREFGESEQGSGPLLLNFDIDHGLTRQLLVMVVGYDFTKTVKPSVSEEGLELVAPPGSTPGQLQVQRRLRLQVRLQLL